MAGAARDVISALLKMLGLGSIARLQRVPSCVRATFSCSLTVHVGTELSPRFGRWRRCHELRVTTLTSAKTRQRLDAKLPAHAQSSPLLASPRVTC